MEKTPSRLTYAWLTDYFNEGEDKRPLSDWRDELKALSPEGKRDLAEQVAALEGGSVK